MDKLANNKFDEQTYETLRKNTFDMEDDRDNPHFKDAVKLCARNKDAKSYNIQKIKEEKMPIAVIEAVNSSKAKKFSANKAGGLHNNTILCKNSKVMLLSNLWNEQGLTNGANWRVRYIVYDQGSRPPELPNFVLIYFPEYKGPPFFTDVTTKEKLVPIAPVTRNWYDSKVEYQRTMIPLIPSYAITIHKSQGQTLDKIILDIGDKEYASGLTYTALSRAKKLENIAFDPLPLHIWIMNIFKSPRFKKRLKEEERLRKKKEERLLKC